MKFVILGVFIILMVLFIYITIHQGYKQKADAVEKMKIAFDYAVQQGMNPKYDDNDGYSMTIESDYSTTTIRYSPYYGVFIADILRHKQGLSKFRMRMTCGYCDVLIGNLHKLLTIS